MTKPAPDNVVSIAAALDAPVDAPDLAKAGDQAPMGGRDDDDDLDRPQMPKECPVKALGVGTDGQTCWYLNNLGQLVPLGPRDHGKNNLHVLFSPRTHLLAKYWPRWSAPVFEGRGNSRVQVKESEIVGFAQDDASEALISACGMAGIFDARGRVRGRGAHQGNGKTLILHLGDKIAEAQRTATGKPKPLHYEDPGLLGRYVYPAGEPSPRPWHQPVKEDVGENLLALLSTWNWQRPLLDPMLALGWAGQAFICGALDWRSHTFLTGGRGTGKSSLNGKGGLFDRLLGKGVMRTGGSSEAAVRQKLNQQTIPVMFDEFEPNEFNASKLKAVIELARIASSGDEMSKGGQDHQAHDFMLQSAFMFSAILKPKMEPQDQSRFAVLELKPLPDDARPLDLDAAKLPELGQKLMRRMVDGWHRYAATYTAYRSALAEVGHDARAQDTFGSLLACADLALYDLVPDPSRLLDWARECDPEGLAEISDGTTEHGACLKFLTTTSIQARGGEDRQTLGTWIGNAMRDVDQLDGDHDYRKRDKKRLQEIGLKVVNVRPLDPDDKGRPRWGATDYLPGKPGFLAVSISHRSLTEIFRDSKWRDGGWTQALGRADGAIARVKIAFGFSKEWAVLVPLDDEIDMAGRDGGGDRVPA